jgi:hypothetical protein
MPRMARARSVMIWLAVAVVAAATAAAYGAAVWPWMAPPATDAAVLEARWADIVRRADTFGPAAARSPELAVATDAIASQWDAAGDMLHGDAAAAAAERPPALTPAIEALVRWSEAGAVVPDLCMNNDVPAVRLARLADVALHTAERPDAAFVAVLRLAQGLRRRGALLGGIVGFSMAQKAAETAQRRGWRGAEVEAELRRYRPTEEELRAVVARESVCSYRLVESSFGGDCERSDPGMRAPWYVPMTASRWCAREKAIVREHFGALHAGAAAEKDLRRFADALAVPDGAAARSLILEALTTPLGGTTLRMVEALAGYEAALAGVSAA